MENPQTPETLHAENPGEKNPKEASGSSCMSDNCSGLTPVSDISMEAKMVEIEEEKRSDSGEIEEKGSLFNNDCVDRAKEEKMDSNMLPACKQENGSKLGLEESKSKGYFGSNGNEDVGVEEMVQDEGISKDKQLKSNGIDLSRKIEVSTEALSLFVEISGSPSKEKINEDRDEKQGENVGNQECDFSVGDIVWVQTKKKTWWPGKIHNPADAPKYATRTGRGDNLLVGYYGISHFAWCRPSQLKAFHENFEQMARENRARIFLGAVEKALDELGRSVKLEMTCSCALEHDQLPERKPSRLGEFSVTSFEPVSFLEHLKYLAEFVSMPCMLDFTVAHNRLSAFYRSMGHRQLPMNVLRERDETEEDKVSGPKSDVAKEGFMSPESRKRKMKRDSEAKVEDIACEKEMVIDKGFNSRERKKSKYLSYPYTEWEEKGAAGTEGPIKVLKVAPQASKVAGKSNTSPNFNGDKFWRKWYRRFTGVSHIPTGLELKNAASTELLCELRSAAVDCLHPSGNDDFNSVCWFLSRFRISVFKEESVENKANGAEACSSDNNAQENSQASQPDETKRKRAKKKESSSQVEHTSNSSNAIGSSETGVQNTSESLDQSSEQDSPTIKKNGKPNSARLKTKPLSGLSDVSISIATNGLSVTDALEKGPALKHKKSKRRKKKKGEEVIGDHLQTKQMTNIPDLNGSSAASSLLVDDPQVMNHVTSEVKTELLKEVEKGAGLKGSHTNTTTAGSSNIDENNAKTGMLVVDLRVPGETSACLNNDCTADLQDFAKERPTNGLPLGDAKLVTIGLLLGESKPRPKKRKRKEKEAPKNIPDLNGASAESNALGKETQKTNNGLTPPVKPKRKRRKRKEQVALQYPRNISFSWRSDYLSYYQTQTNGDAIGTGLLLTFAPGVPMPSREDLVSTFCKFGPLKESETQLLKGPGSAQIVFMRSSDAAEALKDLEKNNPFGAALVSYRLHHLPPVSRTSEANWKMGATLAPSTQAPAAPPLDFIRQNLQMMTSMLETSGNSLSPEMRAKLEAEIKGLLSKVSSMAGSGST